MKEYKLELPDHLKIKKQEIYEFILAKHYENEALTGGACAVILGINKLDFMDGILSKFNIFDN